MNTLINKAITLSSINYPYIILGIAGLCLFGRLVQYCTRLAQPKAKQINQEKDIMKEFLSLRMPTEDNGLMTREYLVKHLNYFLEMHEYIINTEAGSKSCDKNAIINTINDNLKLIIDLIHLTSTEVRSMDNESIKDTLIIINKLNRTFGNWENFPCGIKAYMKSGIAQTAIKQLKEKQARSNLAIPFFLAFYKRMS